MSKTSWGHYVDTGERGPSILITGGTGTMGQHLAANFRDESERVIVYSRDEQKQIAMAREFGEHGRMRYFLGDIRDRDRLRRALKGVDFVIHTAALKVVPKLEYDPAEAVKTNIMGTMNVIEAAIDQGVSRAVMLSTDKAVMPINLYGMTKAVAERLWLDANFYSSIFNVVRYGNVMGSRGSVLQLYKRMHKQDRLPLTHDNMSRFWTTVEEALQTIRYALYGKPQLIYIPDSRPFSMIDLIKALGKVPALVDMRPGEKIHETLIHEYELPRAFFYDDHYRIFPETPWDDAWTYHPGQPVNKPLTSGDSAYWMDRPTLKGLYELTATTH